MSVTSHNWRGALVPLFLAAQILVVHAASSAERPPQPPALTRFPSTFGPWRLFHDDLIDAATARELSADRLISQTYVESPTGSVASLFVAWFQTQREGARQPHSPKVCLPAGGWTPRVIDEIAVDTPAGAITVNRYIVIKGTQRAVVLYWYQTPRRVIAGEWAAKFWLAADALWDKRTDTALVRVITWPAHGGEERATAAATTFARSVYPMLRDYLPR
jgi:EpsI family protein